MFFIKGVVFGNDFGFDSLKYFFKIFMKKFCGIKEKYLFCIKKEFYIGGMWFLLCYIKFIIRNAVEKSVKVFRRYLI